MTAAAMPSINTNTVSRAQVLSALRKGHPRLLASAEDFNRLKRDIPQDPRLRDWHKSVIQHADEFLNQKVSTYEIPDGLRLLQVSRTVLARTYAWAFAYRLEGKRAYLDRLWQELEAAAKFPDWNPRHFLDTAELSHAFAIAYDWLHDDWTPDQRETLRSALVNKAFKPALPLYREQRSWTVSHHNWNQVCNGGIGMGALALAEVEPALAAELIRGTLKSLPLAMASFAPDGAWSEGPGYWNYTTTYNVAYIAALQSALGTDFGLSRMPGFEMTGLFPIYVSSPAGHTFNFADSSTSGLHGAQLSWLAKKFGMPVCAWHGQQTQAPFVLDLIWAQPPAKSPRELGLPLNKYFRAAEVVTLRGAWEDRNASFVGFKAGANGVNHGHLDLGTFVFDALGVRWAEDLGADNYNLPGYFDSNGRRWSYYRMRAEGHNTLVINPGAASDQNTKARTRIERFEPSEARPVAVTDLSAAYNLTVGSVRRGVALLNKTDLLIQDELRTERAVDLWWFMHTKAKAEVAPDGESAHLAAGGKELLVRLAAAPAGAKLMVMHAEPLPESPNPAGQANNKGIQKLAIHIPAATNATISVRLIPLRGDGEPPLIPQPIPLSAW